MARKTLENRIDKAKELIPKEKVNNNETQKEREQKLSKAIEDVIKHVNNYFNNELKIEAKEIDSNQIRIQKKNIT